jgi:hypothetical protein
MGQPSPLGKVTLWVIIVTDFFRRRKGRMWLSITPESFFLTKADIVEHK